MRQYSFDSFMPDIMDCQNSCSLGGASFEDETQWIKINGPIVKTSWVCAFSRAAHNYFPGTGISWIFAFSLKFSCKAGRKGTS